jgi:hypothetical protein
MEELGQSKKTWVIGILMKKRLGDLERPGWSLERRTGALGWRMLKEPIATQQWRPRKYGHRTENGIH